MGNADCATRAMARILIALAARFSAAAAVTGILNHLLKVFRRRVHFHSVEIASGPGL